MFEKGTDMGLTVDVSGLQSLPSVVTDQVEGLSRKKKSRGGHGGGSTTNLCLITLNNVLNDLDVLNIFGGGFGL